jgi:cytochrome d ubiquinol oxidase subunit II
VLGVYFANVFRGIAVDSSGYHGFILELFDLIGLSGGLFFVANAIVTGWSWIRFTTIEGKDAKRDSTLVPTVAAAIALVALIALFLGLNNKANFFASGLFSKLPVLWAVPVLPVPLGAVALLAAWKGKARLQFIAALATMLTAMASLFAAAFPRMVISSITPAFGIDVFAGSSSQTTLNVMTGVAVVFVPLVIVYQAWKFIRFRKDRNEEA